MKPLKRILFILLCIPLILAAFVTFMPIIIFALVLALIKWICTGEDKFDQYSDWCFWGASVMEKMQKWMGI